MSTSSWPVGNSAYPTPLPAPPANPSFLFNGAQVVVTGATGFIGSALLTHLRIRHPDVIPIALARPTSNVLFLERLLDYPHPEETPSVRKASLDDIPSLEQSLRDADVVVHLAAEMDFFSKEPARLFRTNVEGTRNLLEASARESERRGKKMRFVYVSSTEAVGNTEGFGKADEDAPRRPDSHYGRSKTLAEDVVKEYAKRVDTVVARPTGVFGPGERFFYHEMMGMVASGITIVAPSPMTGRCMFTHVEDVIQGLVVCATHPEAVGGVFHICPNESVEVREIVQCMADILEVPRPVLWMRPGFGVTLMRMIAPIMNMRKKRVFMYHPRTVRQSMCNREYSNERLRKLGYQPKYSILSGTEQTLRYEISTGGMKRHFVPSALKGCINIVGVIAFTVYRIVCRKQNAPK